MGLCRLHKTGTCMPHPQTPQVRVRACRVGVQMLPAGHVGWALTWDHPGHLPLSGILAELSQSSCKDSTLLHLFYR